MVPNTNEFVLLYSLLPITMKAGVRLMSPHNSGYVFCYSYMIIKFKLKRIKWTIIINALTPVIFKRKGDMEY